MSNGRILMGVVGRPHGVRGLVRLTSHASTPDVLAVHALFDERGRAWRLTWQGEGIAALTGVATGKRLADRDAAAALTNARLYVERASLPEPDEDEFYLVDLEGLEARDEAGRVVGRVVAVHDYGAGASLEIAGSGRTPRIVPFTRAAVPVVDIAGGAITVVELDEVEVHDEGAPRRDSDERLLSHDGDERALSRDGDERALSRDGDERALSRDGDERALSRDGDERALSRDEATGERAA